MRFEWIAIGRLKAARDVAGDVFQDPIMFRHGSLSNLAIEVTEATEKFSENSVSSVAP